MPTRCRVPRRVADPWRCPHRGQFKAAVPGSGYLSGGGCVAGSEDLEFGQERDHTMYKTCKTNLAAAAFGLADDLPSRPGRSARRPLDGPAECGLEGHRPLADGRAAGQPPGHEPLRGDPGGQVWPGDARFPRAAGLPGAAGPAGRVLRLFRGPRVPPGPGLPRQGVDPPLGRGHPPARLQPLPPPFSRQLPDDRQPRRPGVRPRGPGPFRLPRRLPEGKRHLPVLRCHDLLARIPGRLPVGPQRQGRRLQVPHLHRSQRPRQLEDGRAATAATREPLHQDPPGRRPRGGGGPVLQRTESQLLWVAAGQPRRPLAELAPQEVRQRRGLPQGLDQRRRQEPGEARRHAGQRAPLRSQQRVGDGRAGPRRRTVPLRPARRAARLVRQGRPRGGLHGTGDAVRLARFARRAGRPQPPPGDLHAQLPRPPFGLHEQGFAASARKAPWPRRGGSSPTWR